MCGHEQPLCQNELPPIHWDTCELVVDGLMKAHGQFCGKFVDPYSDELGSLATQEAPG